MKQDCFTLFIGKAFLAVMLSIYFCFPQYSYSIIVFYRFLYGLAITCGLALLVIPDYLLRAAGEKSTTNNSKVYKTLRVALECAALLIWAILGQWLLVLLGIALFLTIMAYEKRLEQL